MFSCTIPKEARLLKKTTEDWRKSPVVLEAYADSPLSGRFLTLRDNGKFEHTSSGLLRSFQAGIWTSNQDTINLSYIDNNQKETNMQKVYIDKKASRLIFEGDTTPAMFRLRILINNL